MQWMNFSSNIQHLTNPHAPTQGAEINEGLGQNATKLNQNTPPNSRQEGKKGTVKLNLLYLHEDSNASKAID